MRTRRLRAPVALLAACGGKPGPRMAIARVSHRLASNDHHESTVAVGQELGTEMTFGAGTGYAWTAKGFDATILALKSQESKSEAPDGVVGGQMAEHLVFEGVKPGETTITFELRRPWEKDVAPAETRTMRVKVTAADGN
jgi:predicted secreted protein